MRYGTCTIKKRRSKNVTVNRWRKAVFFLCTKMRGKERDMNFGQGIYTWLMTNIQPLVLGGIIIVGLVLLFKHKIAELIVFAIIAVIAVGFVFNPSGTKDTMLKIYNGTIIEGGAADDVEDGGK
jgi:type III secretory pathway component EscV